MDTSVFSGKRVLDLGAGESTYTRLIAARYGPALTIACDLFHERLRAAAVVRSAAVSFVAGDALRLPIYAGTIDIVFASLLLCQVPDLDRLASEIGRVLRPGGVFIGIEPNPYNPVHLYRYWFGEHSPNQYILSRRHLNAFQREGFVVDVKYFWAKLPRLRNRFIASCIGIHATLANQR
jgi:ubiquinone/menaquinone biosynthesis C-methylase UbiE